MEDNFIGKRLVFSSLALIIVSIITWHLKFSAAEYTEMLKWIIGAFVGAQTLTDIFGKSKNGEQPK